MIPDLIKECVSKGIPIILKPHNNAILFDLNVQGKGELHYLELPDGGAIVYAYRTPNSILLYEKPPSFKELVDLAAMNMRSNHYSGWRPHVEDSYGIAYEGSDRWISHKDLTEAGYHRFADNSFLWVKD